MSSSPAAAPPPPQPHMAVEVQTSRSINTTTESSLSLAQERRSAQFHWCHAMLCFGGECAAEPASFVTFPAPIRCSRSHGIPATAPCPAPEGACGEPNGTCRRRAVL